MRRVHSAAERAARLLARVVEPAVFAPGLPLHVSARHLDGEPLPFDDAVAGAFEPFALGQPWGPEWGTTWFRLRGRVPEEWAGQQVAVRFEQARCGEDRMSGEALLWRRDGTPVQAFAPHRTHAVVVPIARGGEDVDVYVEAAANPDPPPATAGVDWPLLMPDHGGAATFVLTRCELAVRRPEVYALVCDLRTVLALDAMGGHVDPSAALDAACDLIEDAGAAGVPDFAVEARAALAPVLSAPALPGAHRVSAVGHAHIDTAWLWPIRETVRKCARTFANAVALMEEYTDYHFACSAAQHLAWIQERYPSLFERIRERVRTGQFEPVGGMWVEADCNLPSGESLVRQLVHGKRWFLEHLGRECTELWLPDGFGFPASLPQIMAEAGIRWFVSQKLSWNDTNRFPHHTFWWEGIDGSRVRAHFPPADTYSGEMRIPELLASAARGGARSLYPYGFGDGGGGPTQDMLEAARRAGNLAGVPRVALEPATAFLGSAECDPAPLPVWVGELYFEKHRGTYTSQGAVKRANRRAEGLLSAAELWSAVRPDAGEARYRYPAEALDRAWKLVLTNQFHDILPGSSIRWVYEDAARDHAEVESLVRPIAEGARTAIAAAVDTAGMAEPVVVFNPTPFRRREVVDVGGRMVPVDVPALGYQAVDAAVTGAPGVEVGDGWVANRHLRVAWDGSGRLVSIFDRDEGREIVPSGEAANVFQLHEDNPREWDAWDVDRSYLDAMEELGGPVEVDASVDPDGLRASVRFRRRYGASAIDQTMVLDAGSRRLDFVTDVEWFEDHKFLKVAFPVSVHARRATFEIQFGHVERATHENTSWEQARFEVCAQRWADLSEAGYGVALLNDCKYGYDVRDNVLRLSLLRAPTAPDPLCDRGHHRFTYALLPHAGDLREAGVIDAGYALNAPLEAVAVAGGSGPLPPSMSYLSVETPGFVVETLKRADDGDGLVMRGYEAFGGRRRARVRLPGGIRTAARADLLERPRERLAVEDGSVTVDLRPFELVTIRLA